MLYTKTLALLLLTLLLSAATACSDDVEEDDENNAANNTGNNAANNASNNGPNNAANNGQNNAANNAANNGQNNSNNDDQICAEIEAEYEALLEGVNTCARDEECQVLTEQCSVGLGGCYIFANQSLSQEQLDALGNRYNEEGCTQGVCDCAAPPDRLACLDGRCRPAVEDTQCADLEQQYEALIQDNLSCAQDTDCQVLSGQCSVGLGGCYAYANQDLSQEELRALGEAFSAEGCTQGVCDCDVSSPVACVAGQCTPVERDVCEVIEEEVAARLTWTKSCDEDTDCRTLQTSCQIEGTGCYEIVNQDFSDEDYLAFVADYNAASCFGPDCDCAESPTPACVEGLCVEATEEPNACMLVEQEYRDLVSNNQGCDADDQCQVLFGQCGVGLGGCYEIVNQNVSQEQLNALAERHDPAECFSAVCSCAPPPASAACVNSVCTAVEEGSTCEEIEQEYSNLVANNQSCDSAQDCQALSGQCGVSLGGCYEATNQSVTQDQLDALGREYGQSECFGPVCDCAGPPAVDCVQGVCALIF